MEIIAVVLTFNESIHLDRCIKSLLKITKKILIVDSYSTDNTKKIAEKYNVIFLKNKFSNQAEQFNWALDQINKKFNGWIFRLDADEYLTPKLIEDIKIKTQNPNTRINGYYIRRNINFQGKLIYFGSASIKVIRLFRFGFGKSEVRWMDEHIIVEGSTSTLEGRIIDNNLNSLNWWVSKHKSYAAREALELLNLKYNFKERNNSIYRNKNISKTIIKRYIKEKIYSRLPLGFRAFLYFFYRYIFRLGFLDGIIGLKFHFLHGFWYRKLVDQKIKEVEKSLKENRNIKSAIKKILKINNY